MHQKLFLRMLFVFAIFSAGCESTKHTTQTTAANKALTAGSPPPPQAPLGQTESIACPTQATMCPMIFEPALCELHLKDGHKISAEGNNSCMARGAVLAKFCEGGNVAQGQTQGKILCKTKK